MDAGRDRDTAAIAIESRWCRLRWYRRCAGRPSKIYDTRQPTRRRRASVERRCIARRDGRTDLVLQQLLEPLGASIRTVQCLESEHARIVQTAVLVRRPRHEELGAVAGAQLAEPADLLDEHPRPIPFLVEAEYEYRICVADALTHLAKLHLFFWIGEIEGEYFSSGVPEGGLDGIPKHLASTLVLRKIRADDGELFGARAGLLGRRIESRADVGRERLHIGVLKGDIRAPRLGR